MENGNVYEDQKQLRLIEHDVKKLFLKLFIICILFRFYMSNFGYGNYFAFILFCERQYK